MNGNVMLICCLTIGGILHSCSLGNDDKETRQLEGYWQLQNASINGKQSDRLSSLYFEFKGDSVLHTNILGEDATYGFQKNESEIIQYSMPEIIYSVEQLSDTILTLAAQIQNADFQLDLRRLSDQEEARQVTEN